MGTNLDPRKFRAWLMRNYWIHERTKKHEVWMLQVIEQETGKILLEDNHTFNFHLTNGRGMDDKDVKTMATKMKLTKEEVVKLIRNDKDINDKEYIKKLKR